ncbi:MAG: LysM peptidoglycan-binding domain-containing protein [bacterium]|nr:LysM peptidoglycan-binding domain-containing protein [bacterium]
MSLFKKDVFSLFVIILLSATMIANNGSTGYHGEKENIENKIKRYIDVSNISAILLNRAQSAEISNESSFIGLGGQGFKGNSTNSTVQQTALLAFNSMENDLSSFSGSDHQSNQVAVYTVQEGDTLSFIASDFGVSVNTIIWANNLNNINSIKPGDELKIPPIDGVIHKVKKGDSIGTIAKKYGAEEEKIIAFNALPKDGSIQIDAEIIIPEGKIATPTGSVASSNVKKFSYLPDYGGYFMLPTTGRNWGRIHGRNGVDIANSCGTPIYASAAGIAATADAVGWNGGFGKFIKLVHPNGTETIYAHGSKLLIAGGESVQKGQQIALMGTTGRSTGCHLHFEVHGARNPLAK